MEQSRQSAHMVLIEDNPADVRLLQLALDDLGEPYHLEVLTDGEAALRYIREQCAVSTPNPCLIVLDLHLPRHHGASVLRALRAEPALAHVHVAVVTTQASPKEEAEVVQLGVHLYRRKPVDLDEYVTLASEFLSLCREPITHAAAGSI